MKKHRNRLSVQIIALTGLLSGICFIILLLAGLTPVGWTGLTAVAGLAVAVAIVAEGYISGLLCYSVSGLLSLFLLPSKKVAVIFLLLFGIYPILKNLIECINRKTLEFLLKLVFCEFAVIILYNVAYNLMFQSVCQAWKYSVPFVPVLLLFCGICFFIYDYAFSRLISIIQVRLMPLMSKRLHRY